MQNKAEKKEISPETMRAIYEEVKTPFKAGMALAPEPGEMLDSPVVFRHGDAWFMVFIRFLNVGSVGIGFLLLFALLWALPVFAASLALKF